MLPSPLQRALADDHGLAVRSMRRVGGGSINQAAWLETDRGAFFVKWNDAAPARMFAAEVDGLEFLRETGAGVVPNVLGWAEGPPGYLLMDAIESRPATTDDQARRGEALAAMHAWRAKEFGHEIDNFIGTLPQRNGRTPSAAEFFARERLGVQREIAAQRGSLGPGTLHALDRLCARLPDLVPHVAACRVHGDLWGGNVLTREDGAPVWIDPAVHHGIAEAELAFTTMFGGFTAAFYDAYEQSAGDAVAGWRERVDLWNLYPLLVHANLFGGGYASEARSVILRWA